MKQIVLDKTGGPVALFVMLACGGPATFQVIYSGNVPASGLTVTVIQGGESILIRGNEFTTNGFGTPHSAPFDLPKTGPTQILINLTSSGETLVLGASYEFDAAGGTEYQLSLFFTQRRPVCAHGCSPKATFPSLVPGSSDTLFVFLASPPPPGVLAHRSRHDPRITLTYGM